MYKSFLDTFGIVWLSNYHSGCKACLVCLLSQVVQPLSGADNIRYIHYYSIMVVALASIVHNRYILDYISNGATGCELSTLWAMILYGILLSGLAISSWYNRHNLREYYIFLSGIHYSVYYKNKSCLVKYMG